VALGIATKPVEKRSTIGLPLYIVAAVVLIGGGLAYYYFEKTGGPPPEIPLTTEARQYLPNLKLADVDMKANESYAGQVVVEITGKISNSGDKNLESVEIYCVFADSYGQLVLKKRVPIVSARMGGLKPGETKSFRLPFDELPDSWSHAMPHLVIAGIKFS
jgi:Protein of unknown function (DUF3426)